MARTKKEVRWHVRPYKCPVYGDKGFALWNSFEYYWEGFYPTRRAAEKEAKEWNKEG